MADPVLASTVGDVLPVPKVPRNYSVVAKWTAGAVIGATILTMEWLGKAPAGTWLNVFAVPVLVFIGLGSVPRPTIQEVVPHA
jgi:hypothetical protein